MEEYINNFLRHPIDIIFVVFFFVGTKVSEKGEEYGDDKSTQERSIFIK